MKNTKNLLLSLLLLFASSAIHAQSGLGIKGGVNFNTISTDAGSFGSNISHSFDTKTGYVFGAWGRIGDKFYLQPEVLYSSKGSTLNYTPSGGGSSQSIDIAYNQLDIPILVGFKFLKLLRVMGGPVASIKLSEDNSIGSALSGIVTNNEEFISNSAWGYQLGVGVKVLFLELNLRREGGISEIFKNSDLTSKHAGWQITAALKII